MATTQTELGARTRYFDALRIGDTATAEVIRREFVDLFKTTPEQSLANSQGLALQSSLQGQFITFSDSPTFNAGTNIADISRATSQALRTGTPSTPGSGILTQTPVGASVGSVNTPGLGSPQGNADLQGGRTNITLPPQPPTVPPPPAVRYNNEPSCDYRYSFGCPEFSKNTDGAGCRVFLPIFRTCYPAGNTKFFGIDANNLASFSYAPELMGYIDISNYAGKINESQTNFVQNGIVGTRKIEGTRLTSEKLRQSILDLNSPGSKSRQRFAKQTASNGEIVIVPDTSITGAIDIAAVVANLQDPTISVKPGLEQRKGNINDVIDNLLRTCDISQQPSYCITSETFTKNPDVTPPSPQGPFVNRNVRVEIPGTRKPTDVTEKRSLEGSLPGTPQKHPNKPCVIATPRTYEDIQIWEVQYGYAIYSNQDFIGPIIGYEPLLEPTEKYPVSRGTYVEYTNEIPDPNCGFKEIVNEYEEDDPSDRCFGIIKKDVTRLYDDGRTELFLKGAFVRYYRKQDADCSPETVKVYHPLDLGRDVMTAKIRAKTKGLFDGLQTLECHHTSSTQPTSSKTHYYEVTDCDSCGKTPYFAVAYGHNQGSGSTWSEGELNDTPTRAIYSQYRLLALDLPDTEFTFYTNGVPTASKDVYVVNFSRIGMSDRVDPGNWEIDLAELRGGSYANNVFTGSNVAVSSSNKILTFIDDSDDRSDTISCTHDPYVSYDVVSGSLNSGVYSTNSKHTYGIVYPNLGIIVLDPYKLNTELGFNTVTGSNVAGDNAFKLFTSISGSGARGSYMKARNVKYKTTNHYFVRVAAPLANYSNNPTYVSGSNGQFFHPCYDLNPQTYITTVGLYNDFNELLAVAKLSRPINKSFDNDVLIKIRLNW